VAAKQRTELNNNLGGDFFEVVQSRDGRVSTVMADVEGNGPSAAIHVADVRWNLRQQLARGAPPAEVLATVNEWLAHDKVLANRFVTALCARIDVRTGRTEIAGAGHLGPFLKRASGKAEHLTLSPALALGILPGETYHPIALDLQPEDALILVTDGVTDRLATPGDPLGERALVRQLGSRPRTIEEMCDALLGPKTSRARGVDATVIVLQIPPRRNKPGTLRGSRSPSR
jgi:serine phosphatase RsbU (regulator of sigma subunit)